MSIPAVAGRVRTRVRVEGTVQGVGFRPYVYRVAGVLGLDGFVLNDAHGVLVEVEGSPDLVAQFAERLVVEVPPLAKIERVSVAPCQPTGTRGFAIRESPRDGVPDAPVTPDSATCADCLAEVSDPDDRRYRYPFTNCTNCGPRFTIVRGVPYDRPFTTMAGFRMCERCQAEYDDPGDRRFHAQPNACPECGPSVSLVEASGGPAALGGARDGVAAAAAALLAGRILALKGVGGFHLACRADDEDAVGLLRARKHREDKPFALMPPDLETARALVSLTAEAERLLLGSEAPIVLAPRRPAARVAWSVAPGSPELGIMLPYSPLHHLLLADAATTLVMTSGNVSDEPIAYGDDDARARLANIADVFLFHDRPIQTRTDDSVVRALPGRTTFLRRSRGYVPASIALSAGVERPVLGCGAELKSTFCLAKGERAWVGHHIGDLKNYETLRSFQEGVAHFERLFAVTPEVIAHDLHPEYLSTKYAAEREGAELVGVQHHHAHLAACLAEHGESGPALGAIFDGTGYGEDRTVWGGELLLGDLGSFRRVGMLLPVRLPGGERAIRQPWRMACAWLTAAGDGPPPIPRALRGQVPDRMWEQVSGLVRTGVASPLTTSMGRLFDGVAALCGLRAEVNYEGQAAIELEAACEDTDLAPYPLALEGSGELLVIDPRATIDAIVADIEAGVPVGSVATRFHDAVAGVAVTACTRAACEHGVDTIVLSGGVFQNRRLLTATAAGLRSAALRVLVPERLPCNDGGIAYGQVAVAAWRMAHATT